MMAERLTPVLTTAKIAIPRYTTGFWRICAGRRVADRLVDAAGVPTVRLQESLELLDRRLALAWRGEDHRLFLPVRIDEHGDIILALLGDRLVEGEGSEVGEVETPQRLGDVVLDETAHGEGSSDMGDKLSYSAIVRAVAQQAGKRITRKVITALQRMKETLSGEGSKLETTSRSALAHFLGKSRSSYICIEAFAKAREHWVSMEAHSTPHCFLLPSLTSHLPKSKIASASSGTTYAPTNYAREVCNA